MEFIFFWLSTSVTSFIMEISNELRVFKDAADAGYKIDIRKMTELSEKLNKNAIKVKHISMLIPIFNIIQVFISITQYNNIRPMILDQLSAMDILEEMTETEKKEYSKKTTGLNAMKIIINSEVKLKNAALLKINNDNEFSEIYYEISATVEDITKITTKDVTIIKVKGDASNLTEEEQKKKVVCFWTSINQFEVEIIKEDSNTILEENKETIPSLEKISISKRKEALENEKNKLLAIANQNTTGKKLTRKKKC